MVLIVFWSVKLGTIRLLAEESVARIAAWGANTIISPLGVRAFLQLRWIKGKALQIISLCLISSLLKRAINVA